MGRINKDFGLVVENSDFNAGVISITTLNLNTEALKRIDKSAVDFKVSLGSIIGSTMLDRWSFIYASKKEKNTSGNITKIKYSIRSEDAGFPSRDLAKIERFYSDGVFAKYVGKIVIKDKVGKLFVDRYKNVYTVYNFIDSEFKLDTYYKLEFNYIAGQDTFELITYGDRWEYNPVYYTVLGILEVKEEDVAAPIVDSITEPADLFNTEEFSFSKYVEFIELLKDLSTYHSEFGKKLFGDFESIEIYGMHYKSNTQKELKLQMDKLSDYKYLKCYNTQRFKYADFEEKKRMLNEELNQIQAEICNVM